MRANPDHRFHHAPDVQSFHQMHRAYSALGGIAWGKDLMRLLTQLKPEHADSNLSHIISTQELFYFEWEGEKWLPMIQFRRDDMSVNLAVRQVRRELGDKFDGWEASSWFVREHPKLQDRRPVEVMDHGIERVMEVARSDRLRARD